MAWRAMAWTLTILAVVILSLTFAPNWSMAFLILLGKIAHAFDGYRRSRVQPFLPVTDPLPAGGDPPPLRPPPLRPPPSSGAPAGAGASPESSSSSSSRKRCEVFLNFRGSDTRMNFTDRLFNRLDGVGISVFKDDENLRNGEKGWPELKEVIKQSRISIAILSRDFASSQWCLKELVEMQKCRNNNEQTIIPIFYDVSRSEVIHQAGDFGEAFSLHKTAGVDSKTIETWEKVLREIGRFPGGYIGNQYEGSKAQLVEDVVAFVGRVLKKNHRVVADKLVGIEDVQNEDVSEYNSSSIDSNNSGGSVLENSIEDNRLTNPIQHSSINQNPFVSQTE